ncbi:hypothetical protein VNO78_15374 [Psophocarpus tetragonolobus]|uniref:Uncharacterized protein n=1 Tax=Psophocarpus tetragonolobus TaxID=3891 RepID=A0AAN9SDX1_PSOTE
MKTNLENFVHIQNLHNHNGRNACPKINPDHWITKLVRPLSRVARNISTLSPLTVQNNAFYRENLHLRDGESDTLSSISRERERAWKFDFSIVGVNCDVM